MDFRQLSLTTQRLQLQPICAADAAFMLKLVNTEGWLKFIGDRNVHTTEDALVYLNKILSTPDLAYWKVSLLPDQTPVGIVSFMKRDYLEHFDLGFAFLPEYCGKGYALEASRAVLQKMCEDPDHQQVLATTLPGNRSSIRLLEKLGFEFHSSIRQGDETLDIYAYRIA